MNNPKLAVEVDGVEQQIELLLLSSSRRLSDEVFIQKQMGYTRYRDWSTSGEGWSAPDAQDALIRVSLKRADVDFTDMDVDADAVVEAIVDTLRVSGDGDSLDPTNGK